MKKKSNKKWSSILLLSLFVLFFIFCLKNINAQTIPQPLYWFPFDIDLKDKISNSYTLQDYLSNSFISNFGKINNSSFIGNGGDLWNDTTTFPKDVCISFWLYLNQSNDNNETGIEFYSDDGHPFDLSLTLYGFLDEKGDAIVSQISYNGAEALYQQTNYKDLDSNWYLITFTVNSIDKTIEQRLYVNTSLLFDNITTLSSAYENGADINIADLDSTPLYIDELKIFDYSCNLEMITSIYQNESQGIQYPYITQSQEETNTTNSTSCDLTSTNEKLDLLIGGNNMIALTLLYIFFLSFGIYLYYKRQTILGICFIALTIGMDFFFIQYYYLTYVSGQITGEFKGMFLFLFAMSFLFWIILKIFMPIKLGQKNG